MADYCVKTEFFHLVLSLMLLFLTKIYENQYYANAAKPLSVAIIAFALFAAVRRKDVLLVALWLITFSVSSHTIFSNYSEDAKTCFSVYALALLSFLLSITPMRITEKWPQGDPWPYSSFWVSGNNKYGMLIMACIFYTVFTRLFWSVSIMICLISLLLLPFCFKRFKHALKQEREAISKKLKEQNL